MTPDQIAGFLGLIKDGGTILLLTAAVWAFYTERVIPAGRLKDANDRIAKAETQRDDAMEVARDNVAATKEAASTARDTLQYIRDNLPKRRA